MTADVQNAIQRVKNGDTRSFSEIIRTFQNDVWRIVSFTLLDTQPAEDLVQQVFVTAFKSLDKYDPDLDFGVWLRTIARNLTKNEIRRRIREKTALKSYHEHLITRLDNPENSELYENNLLEKLMECLDSLSPNAANALDLRYKQSMSFEKIAELLGRTLTATRQMLTRIRLAVRKCIEERTTA